MSYLKQSHVRIDTPMAPPAWALMEWELIRAQERACGEFFERYFDERGYLECIPRWGGNDGPDDTPKQSGETCPLASKGVTGV